ncbi:hypothetical protein Cob_v008229 [Colletotrichum orbiculare MAFF 240422]|uniref:Uncharacterized protein n=1 Tax=Colletotrichum orbiculare (strain 104-T / ATCC 96160 / CBS 514.97 / LARS 414 / MAFF 240422) TaxID=1213857 RepID=A0A484FLC7_COLOR|nr:hypothetical protein Cob_v008229 [Colletotrichum orbiculare MAFF 240422]
MGMRAESFITLRNYPQDNCFTNIIQLYTLYIDCLPVISTSLGSPISEVHKSGRPDLTDKFPSLNIMANNGPIIKSEPGASDNQAWDEKRLEDALDQLKLLHIKLRGLRTTIPRMMEPLSVKQPSPQDTYVKFMQSVEGARQEIQDFKSHQRSAEITKIMDHATARRREEPHGIKAWRATDHPDWVTDDSSA